MRIRARWNIGLALLLGVVVLSMSPVGSSTNPARPRHVEEGGAPGHRPTTDVVDWRAHVALVDQALAQQDVSAALRAWQDAYGMGLASRRWDAMLDVGDAFVRIGHASGTAEGFKPNARQAYLVAFQRAQRDRSAEAVRRVAVSFERIGDEEIAALIRRVAAERSADAR